MEGKREGTDYAQFGHALDTGKLCQTRERESLRKWMDLVRLSLRKANITEMLADRH